VNGPNIATGSADTCVRLWSLNPDYEFQKSIELKGHEDTVNYIDFHPMGKHIASGSNDKTWKLWDIEYKKLLLT
jgi:U4/U6 small nuclear ribonucleoprotein PRP4